MTTVQTRLTGLTGLTDRAQDGTGVWMEMCEVKIIKKKAKMGVLSSWTPSHTKTHQGYLPLFVLLFFWALEE